VIASRPAYTSSTASVGARGAPARRRSAVRPRSPLRARSAATSGSGRPATRATARRASRSAGAGPPAGGRLRSVPPRPEAGASPSDPNPNGAVSPPEDDPPSDRAPHRIGPDRRSGWRGRSPERDEPSARLLAGHRRVEAQQGAGSTGSARASLRPSRGCSGAFSTTAARDGPLARGWPPWGPRRFAGGSR
jgi:hypothetical protein